MKAFIIGDIHGSLTELKELIQDIDRSTTRIILVGDLIDRGKDSEGVIDFVRDNNIECVRGNHEDMLIECIPYLIEGNKWALGDSDWYLNGGHDVFNQYSSLAKLIADAEWLKTLPKYIETGIINDDGKELLVSHAWTAQYNDIQQMSKQFTFTWNRNQPKYPIDTPYYNIFGHTPTNYLNPYKYITKSERPEPIFYENACNIDTGCAYDTIGRGWLTGVFFPSLTVKQVELKDRK